MRVAVDRLFSIVPCFGTKITVELFYWLSFLRISRLTSVFVYCLVAAVQWCSAGMSRWILPRHIEFPLQKFNWTISLYLYSLSMTLRSPSSSTSGFCCIDAVFSPGRASFLLVLDVHAHPPCPLILLYLENSRSHKCYRLQVYLYKLQPPSFTSSFSTSWAVKKQNFGQPDHFPSFAILQILLPIKKEKITSVLKPC